MFTVSLIGPDGVGKTTIARKLEASFPRSVKYIYMGLNTGSANYILPTTRLWNDRKRRMFMNAGIRNFHELRKMKRVLNSSPIPFYKLPAKVALKTMGLANALLEEWYRHFIAWIYEKRGYIVIFDRHFIYDFHGDNGDSHDSLYRAKRRIHDFILKHTTSKPELVICLDAPSEVIFSRKDEFTMDEIEIKRQNYLNLANIHDNFTIIDASRSLEAVVNDVGNRIFQFHQNLSRHARRKK